MHHHHCKWFYFCISPIAVQNNAREVDYLTPFIRNVADPTMLTMAEAMEVRQACLDALKVLRLFACVAVLRNQLMRVETGSVAGACEHYPKPFDG